MPHLQYQIGFLYHQYLGVVVRFLKPGIRVSLTGSLVSLVPKMFHGVIHFFHLKCVVFHNSAKLPIKSLVGQVVVTAYLSKALAYFSRSLFAMSDICT